ncbi:MAG: hypothetical protein AAGC55_31000, partial [Myxococcota bacterium]
MSRARALLRRMHHEVRRRRPTERVRRRPTGSSGTRSSKRPQHSPIGRWVAVRIYVAGAILTLLFAGIGYRAYGLQIGKADKYRALAQRQHLHTVEIPAPRGPVLDSKGRELAVTADV